MPRKFKTRRRQTIYRPVVNKAYPLHPVGSNGWHQEKARQRIVNEITERLSRENKKR